MSGKMIFTIRDKAAGTYFTPMFVHNELHALREYKMAMAMADTPMHHSPDDFQLIHIGYYDPDSGTIDACDEHVVVADGAIETHAAEAARLKSVQ
jgi:hypothetical protein